MAFVALALDQQFTPQQEIALPRDWQFDDESLADTLTKVNWFVLWVLIFFGKVKNT